MATCKTCFRIGQSVYTDGEYCTDGETCHEITRKRLASLKARAEALEKQLSEAQATVGVMTKILRESRCAKCGKATHRGEAANEDCPGLYHEGLAAMPFLITADLKRREALERFANIMRRTDDLGWSCEGCAEDTRIQPRAGNIPHTHATSEEWDEARLILSALSATESASTSTDNGGSK